MTHKKIRTAAAFIDESPRPGWRASDLLTIGYAILATAGRRDLGEAYVEDMLQRARDRFRDGQCCDPFSLLPGGTL